MNASFRRLTSFLAALSLAACLQPMPASPPDVALVAAPSPRPVEPPGVPGQAAVHPPGRSRYCLPAALPHTVREEPRAPGLIRGACLLDRYEYDANADGKIEASTEYLRKAGEVTQVIRGSGAQVVALETLGVDGGGREILWRSASPQGQLRYQRTRLFDGEGRLLLAEERGPGGAVIQAIEQRFEWNVPVFRQHRDSTGATWTLRWLYDAEGRLSEAWATPSTGPGAHVTYRYDRAGHPLEIVRELGGVEAERQHWSYTAQGALEGHTVALRRVNAYLPFPLDSFQRAAERRSPYGAYGYGYGYWDGYGYGYGTYGYEADPGGAPPAAQGCRELPSAPGSGYAEADYDLGFLEDERPTGIGSAYGYYGYYGYQGSYGHLGVGQPWDGDPGSAEAVRFETRYDAAGRMVDEEAHHDGPTASQRHVRERTFDAQGLAEDTVHWFSGTGEAYARTLRFGRDGDGHLVRRELIDDGGILELQRWDWDAGHPSRHELAPQPVGLHQRKPVAQPVTPVITLRYTRDRDAAARIIGEGFEDLRQGSRRDVTFRRDGAGQVLEQLTRATTPSHTADSVQRAVFSFDAQGRPLTTDLSSDYGARYHSESWERHLYDARGNLLRHEAGSSATGVNPSKSALSYRYSCSAD